jgi:hypothetical protein
MVGRLDGRTGAGLLLAWLLAAACGGRSTWSSEEPGEAGTGGTTTGGTGGAGGGGTGGSCEQVLLKYASALREARTCDRALRVEQCDRVVMDAVRCGCPTYANGSARLYELSTDYEAYECGGPVTCGACPEPPIRGACGPDNLCFDMYAGIDE